MQKHRPIRRVTRDPTVLITAVILNTLIAFCTYKGLEEIKHSSVHIPAAKLEAFTAISCLLIATVTFIVTAVIDPGVITPKFDFIPLVNEFLDLGIHVDQLCVFCEVIKTEQSFHCTICGHCVEQYDHHCPFLNTCLGQRNHKWFLVFLLTYSLFDIIVFIAVAWRFVSLTSAIGFISAIHADWYNTALGILILVHSPAVVY